MFSWLNDFTQAAGKTLSQFNNKTFKDAAMAVCALVSASDGSISKAEKSKVAALIQKNELLQVFNATELRDLFLSFADKATDEFARLDLFNLVRKLKGNDAQADTALKVALIIANSDGNFSDSEKAVVRELCTNLNLSPATYGV